MLCVFDSFYWKTCKHVNNAVLYYIALGWGQYCEYWWYWLRIIFIGRKANQYYLKSISPIFTILTKAVWRYIIYCLNTNHFCIDLTHMYIMGGRYYWYCASDVIILPAPDHNRAITSFISWFSSPFDIASSCTFLPTYIKFYMFFLKKIIIYKKLLYKHMRYI